MNLRRFHIAWSLYLAFLFGEVKAQSACFTMEDLGGQPISAGCIPDMIIQFLDCSNVPYRSIDNGNSYNSHTWDFGYLPGTGNSNVQSPVFGYFESDTFTITLTVTADGSNYTTATNTIIVYESPIVDMSVTPSEGCNPLTVCFTDLSASSSSAIVSWIWDFGDGAISPQQNPCHTYRILPQQNCFSPTLRVENALGCVAARTFQNAICVDLPPQANFTSNLRILCSQPYTVNFSFTGYVHPGNNATYLWDFGDGSPFGTGANPSHTYQNDSTYNVTLTVTDTDCSLTSTVTRNAWISTREINADFLVTETVFCAGGCTQFINTSTGTDSANFTYLWNFGFPGGASAAKDPNFCFPNPGTYTVTLIASDPAGCTDTETKTALITVNPRPTATFTASDSTNCSAPFTVSFTTPSCTNCTYTWDLGDSTTSTLQNPTHTYDTTGSFSVSLEVTDNTNGCTGTRVKSGYINIAPRNFAFAMDRTMGCAPLQVRFIDVSQVIGTDPITGFVWNFDDPASGSTNNTSNLSTPVHMFNDTGKYAVEMCVVTQQGCTGCFTDTVFVGASITPSFDINPNPACVNEPVEFENTTNDSNLPPGDSLRYFWDFVGAGTSILRDPPPQVYDQPDTFIVKLAAGIYGCFDTVEQQLIINFPKAEFYFEQDCANPCLVVFRDTSKRADTWLWDFGDTNSTSNSSTLQHPTHCYDTSGTYNVMLIVTNDSTGCVDSFSLSVTVSLLDVDFDVSDTEICTGETVTFTNRSTGLIAGATWYLGEGAPVTGQTPSFTYTTPGRKTIKLVVTDALGCRDSLELVNHINVTGVTADFTASNQIGCIPPTGTGNTVTFTSTSVASGSTLTRYYWDFGNGTIDSTSGATVTYTYTTPGIFTVTLRVRSAAGCEDTETKVNFINMRQPNATFTTAGTLFCRDQLVTTTNTTQGGGTFTWNFGCIGCSDVVAINPSHVYTDTGTFNITMSVVDANGCEDDALPVTVRVTIPDISFGVDTDTSYCPPHVACFDNLSTLDTVAIDRVLWDFGDGSFSTLNDPCHIYTRAGFFTVTLTVWFVNLCVDSLTESTFIRIGGATGDLVVDPDTGCAPMPVVMSANSQGAASIYWYFPWSQEENRIGGDTVHSIVDDPGVWQPFIVLTDTQTPQPCSYVLYTDTLVVADSATARFIVSSDSVCRADPIQFTDASFTFVGDSIVEWLWDFGDGITSVLQNPTHPFTNTGWNTVCLTATSKIGCSATFCDDIYVLDKPTACFTVSDDSGCDVLLVQFTNCSTPGIDAPIPGTGYYWDLDGDLNTINDIRTTPNPLPYQYSDTGRYDPILVVTDLNGCDDTTSIPINVYKTPDGILLGDVVQICERDTIQLFTDSITYAGYQWSPPNGLSSTTAQHPFAFPTDTITYTVDITEGHGCDMTDTIRINVVPLPPLTLNPSPTAAICLGDSIQLIATGGLSYTWTPNPGFLSAYNIPNPIARPPVTFTSRVTITGLAGCQNSDTVRIIVNNLNASFAGERSCLGDSTNYIDFSTRSDLPIVSWFWDFGGDGSSTLRNPAHTYSDSGTYTVQLVVMDARGCTDTATGTTIIDFPPSAAAGTNSVICLGDSIQLFATGGTDFIWTPGPYILNPTTSNPIVFPISTTTYIANVTNGVCPYDAAEVEIIVMPLPVVQTIDDTYIVRGETIELVTTADRYISVLWTPADSLNCPTCLSPFARPYVKTTYRVTVTDQFGCEGFDEVTIDSDVECKEEQVFVANAFTPNGDGNNDELHLHLRGIEKVNYYRIFDRWGKLVFETKDMQEGWDGKNLDGQNLSSGVYVYVVDAVCFYGKSILKTGNVTLIK